MAKTQNGSQATQEAKTCTVIQFARLVDRPAQQFYQMVRNGSVPSELIKKVAKPDGNGFQPMFYQDAMLEWWNARQQKRQQGTVKVVAGADQVISRLQDMLNASDDPEVKKLADAMAKVMAAMQQKQ